MRSGYDAADVMRRPALVCIVGPPAAGKSLLILSLTEEFRRRGRRVASAVLRDASTTVLTLSSGARVTVARAPQALELPAFIRSIEPDADLILAEGFSGPGIALVEVTGPEGLAPARYEGDLLAMVPSTDILGDFARSGPTTGAGVLADLIEARLLSPGRPGPPPASRRRGFFDRLRGR